MNPWLLALLLYVGGTYKPIKLWAAFSIVVDECPLICL